jgi:hypothetical protein
MDPTFPYAGNVRIPPAQFHLRTRIEKSTRDFTNAKQFEHWQTDTPSLTNNYPKRNYSKGRMYETVINRPVGYSRISDEENRKLSEQYYGTSNLSYRDPESDRAPTYARETIEQSVDILTGYKQPNYKLTNIPYYDMESTNTRGDARDYKQSQPYVAGGPDLEYNPYFDRYDPVRDPRNAVRELRSAVYEDRGGNRSEKESQKFLRRQVEHRWNAEELIDDDKMDTFLRYEIATAEKQSNQIELQ